jgi:triacylglycerol lipase
MQHALVIAIALLCVQVLVAGAWIAWRWANRTKPPFVLSEAVFGRVEGPVQDEPPAWRDHPPAVVLVHGIFGFGSIGLGRARIHYFRRVAQRLEKRGVEVHVATLPPLGGTPARALALQAQLERVKSSNIVIFAHSLGGLDARWALSRGGCERVRALVTIGTPHRGSPIADVFASGPATHLRRALARTGLVSDAVDWLTTERLARFNEEIRDVPGVRYASVVAATADGRRIHPLLRVTHAFLKSHGPNDGLVTAASQTWGEVIAEAELDHWAQVGWGGDADAAALVESVLESLGALPPGTQPKRLPSSTPTPTPTALAS